MRPWIVLSDIVRTMDFDSLVKLVKGSKKNIIRIKKNSFRRGSKKIYYWDQKKYPEAINPF